MSVNTKHLDLNKITSTSNYLPWWGNTLCTDAHWELEHPYTMAYIQWSDFKHNPESPDFAVKGPQTRTEGSQRSLKFYVDDYSWFQRVNGKKLKLRSLQVLVGELQRSASRRNSATKKPSGLQRTRRCCDAPISFSRRSAPNRLQRRLQPWIPPPQLLPQQPLITLSASLFCRR